MKTNVRKIVVLSLVGIFSIINVYQFGNKNKRSENKYSASLLTQGLIDAIAYGEDFPEDPFKGENQGELKYEKRIELQYYKYEYTRLNTTTDGENVYYGYKTPVTEIDCQGHGDLACYKGTYTGMSESLGEVKESERKD